MNLNDMLKSEADPRYAKYMKDLKNNKTDFGKIRYGFVADALPDLHRQRSSLTEDYYRAALYDTAKSSSDKESVSQKLAQVEQAISSAVSYEAYSHFHKSAKQDLDNERKCTELRAQLSDLYRADSIDIPKYLNMKQELSTTADALHGRRLWNLYASYPLPHGGDDSKKKDPEPIGGGGGTSEAEEEEEAFSDVDDNNVKVITINDASLGYKDAASLGSDDFMSDAGDSYGDDWSMVDEVDTAAAAPAGTAAAKSAGGDDDDDAFTDVVDYASDDETMDKDDHADGAYIKVMKTY